MPRTNLSNVYSLDASRPLFYGNQQSSLVVSCIQSVKHILEKVFSDPETLFSEMRKAENVPDLASRISRSIAGIIGSRWEDGADAVDTHAEQIFEELQSQFFQGRVSVAPELWDELRRNEFFLTNIIRYIKRYIGTIFNHHDTESVYNKIEFALFLLGAPEDLDIIIDIQSSQHSAIENRVKSHYERIERMIDDMGEWNLLALEIKGFVQLMETLNKIISLHAVGKPNRDHAIQLFALTQKYISKLINLIGGISFFSEETQSLTYTLGKFAINYSHLEFFNGGTEKDIKDKAEEIRKKISDGFDLLESVNHNGNISAKFRASMVKMWNLAYVSLLELKKLQEWGFISEEEALTKKSEHIKVLHRIYLKEIPFESIIKEFQDSTITYKEMLDYIEILFKDDWNSKKEITSEDILSYFLENERNPDNVKLETIHHLILFDESISGKMLEEIGFFLTKWSPYKSIYHEEYRVKTLSVILQKLNRNREISSRVGDAIAEYLNAAIQEHSPLSEHPYAHLELALFYASRNNPEEDTETNRTKAKLSFVHYNYIDPETDPELFSKVNLVQKQDDSKKRTSFDAEKKAFFSMISEREAMDYQQIRSTSQENIIRAEFESITDWIREKGITELKEKADAPRMADSTYVMEDIYSLVRRLFYNIPLAQEEICPHSVSSDISCRACIHRQDCRPIPRGSLDEKIHYGEEKHLLFLYPANMQLAFMRIFNKEKVFIINQLNRIEHGLKQNRKKKTKHLSGLPNYIAFEEHLQELQGSKKKMDFLLLNITNEHVFKNGAISKCAPHIYDLVTRKYPWIRVFHLGDTEFVFALWTSATESITEIAADIERMFIDFDFPMPDVTIGRTLVTDSMAKPIVRIAYIQNENASIKDKLDSALRNSGDDIVQYQEKWFESDYLSADIESALRTALVEAMKNNRIVPYYQEIHHAHPENAKNHPRKFECLMRIFDKDGNMLPLDHCLRIAESYGLSKELTLQMTERICQEIGQQPNIEFSINACPNDLRNQAFIHDLIAIAKRYGLAEQMIVELVETPLPHGDEEVISNLSLFAEEWIKIAIDDYGQQASGLERVKRMNPYYVKLDRVFSEELKFALIRNRIKSTADSFTEKFYNIQSAIHGHWTEKAIIESEVGEIEALIQPFMDQFEDLRIAIRGQDTKTADKRADMENVLNEVAMLIHPFAQRFGEFHTALKELSWTGVSLENSMTEIKNLMQEIYSGFRRMQIAIKWKTEDANISLDIARTDISCNIQQIHVRGMQTIVEFVETEEIANELRKLGGDWLQGYHFGKPVPFGELQF